MTFGIVVTRHGNDNGWAEGKAPGDVTKVAREFRSSVPVGMGCGTSRAVSTQPETGTEDSLERKRKIKNNRKSSKLNIIDDSPGSKISEEDLITLPGAVQQSLPPLRKANGTLLQNGFNDDLALTANSLLKKNGPIQEIRDRPRSVDILQELLVQGILNQAHNEEWQEVHSPMFDVKSPEGILKKPPPRLDKLKNETTVQKSATIEEIENKMIAAEERRKMKEIKLKERLNKFNTSPMIMQDGRTRISPELDQAKLEEVVEKINSKQKEIHQEKQEITKEKDENSDLVDETGLTQQESKINTGECCEVVEFDDGHYLTRKIADEVIVNKI